MPIVPSPIAETSRPCEPSVLCFMSCPPHRTKPLGLEQRMCWLMGNRTLGAARATRITERVVRDRTEPVVAGPGGWPPPPAAPAPLGLPETRPPAPPTTPAP